MSKEELVELFDNFLNEKGQWMLFKDWIESKGYSMKELGFDDD